jgi:cytochrome c553
MKAVKTRSRSRRIVALSGWLLTAVAVVAGIAYGPELYGLLQLGKQVNQISEDDTRAGGAWPRPSEACIGCHGYVGNAGSQTYPHLAGQPEPYLKKQLVAFASGERSDPNMTPMALSMPSHELDSLVAYFSKTAPLQNKTFHGDAARVARGEALVKANNCAVSRAAAGRERHLSAIGRAGPRLPNRSAYALQERCATRCHRRDAGGRRSAVETGYRGPGAIHRKPIDHADFSS